MDGTLRSQFSGSFGVFAAAFSAGDATAPGATLSGVSAFNPGAASGASSGTAPGAVLSGTSSVSPGSATGTTSATAPGSTLNGTSSLNAGSAVAINPGIAPGATLDGTSSLSPGLASASNPDAVAPGSTLTGLSAITPGAAFAVAPDATAAGATLNGSSSLSPGSASNGTVPDDLAVIYAMVGELVTHTSALGGSQISALAKHDFPVADHWNGEVMATDHLLRYPASSFPPVKKDDQFLIDGYTYVTLETAHPILDGREHLVPLVRL